MAEVQIRGLVKRFGALRAVDGLDLHVAEGEFITLLGPSGCGKTTTLRCLAGLETPSGGEIMIGGETVAAPERRIFVRPEKRRTGMVFQSYALWPHMTVFANVAYPLRLARVPKRETAARVLEMLDRVGLADSAGKMATALSGGQQQRVALARAMVARPRLMFFDEPLSNLDAKLRYSMRAQIRSLHDTFGTTSIYVTHDQEEAITLADRIIVMKQGRIEQVGTPRELYARPATRFVADFMGFQNLWDATVAGPAQDGAFITRVNDTAVTVRIAGDAPGPVGTPVSLAFRSSRLRVPSATAAAAGQLTGTVLRTTYLGDAINVLIDLSGVTLRARLDQSDIARLAGSGPTAGDSISLELPPEHVVALPPHTQPRRVPDIASTDQRRVSA